MKLVVLVDDNAGPGLRADRGLSVYIDSGSWRALFDAGSDPAVLEFNANALGIDLGSLDFVVVSHHHLAHVGGLLGPVALRPGIPVYAPPGPLERLEAVGLRPIAVESARELAPGAYSVGPLHAGAVDEMAMAVGAGAGYALLVGCGHPGIDALARKALEDLGGPLALVLGGFHSPSRDSLDALAAAAGRICPGHCSGTAASDYLMSNYPDKYCGVRSGLVIGI